MNIIKTGEDKLLKLLEQSEYINVFNKNNKLEENKKIITTFINYSIIKFHLGEGINTSVVFDYIYEIVKSDYRMLKKVLRMTKKSKIKTDKTNILNYIIELFSVELKDEIKGNEYNDYSGFHIEYFFEILRKKQQNSEIKKKASKTLLKTDVRSHLKDYLREIGQGALSDEDRMILPEDYYYLDKDSMEKMLKKIKEISMKNGNFTTDLRTKGVQVKGVIPTGDIEDITNFLGSSLAYAKKSKKIFIKQIMEKEVLKFEKPSYIQDEKRHRFNLYLENSLTTQEQYKRVKGNVTIKYTNLQKILSTLLISDLSYIFSQISHWNLDIIYHFLPIVNLKKNTNNIQLIDVAELMGLISNFISYESFKEVYRFVRIGNEKLIFNTINYGDNLMINFHSIKKESENLVVEKSLERKKMAIGKNISLFMLITDDEKQAKKKKNEISGVLSKEIILRKGDLFFVIILNKMEKKIEFYKLTNNLMFSYISVGEYPIDDGFKKIRADFFKELLEGFGG